MILRMSNTKGAHGRALTRFLEQVWAAEGSNPNKWARQHGFSGPTVHRWGVDTDPAGFEMLRKIARELGRPLLDVLVICEYITKEEAGGHEVVPVQEPSSVADAVRNDSALSDDGKAVVMAVYSRFAEGQQGRVVGGQPRKRKPSTKR